MAYKSRVKNQYYGATFGGNIYSSRSSDTTDLVNSLKTISPDLSQIAETYVDDKRKKAEQKINELFLTKDAATIRTEILNGEHPELSSQYVQKTVSFHTGKHEAASTIAEIEKNKKDYNFKDGDNLSSFYKKFLPDFSAKDGSYALGFASIFDEYKANAAVADAKERSDWAQEQKIAQGVSILDSSQPEDIIAKANGLKLVMPPDKYNNKRRELYTNEEINDVLIAWATNKFNTATTAKEIDDAIFILKSPRKLDAKGNAVIGSLYETKREDVAKLIGQLNQKRVTLENQRRVDEKYALDDAKTNIWLKSITPKEDGSLPTLAEKDKMRQELEALDPSDINGVNNFIAWHSTDPKDKSIASTKATQAFKLGIARGEYETRSELVQAYVENGIQGDIDTYIRLWKSSETTITPIFDRNPTYTSAKDSIEEEFKVLYPKDALGNSQAALYITKAHEWMNEQILDWEQEKRDKNETITLEDRLNFTKQLKTQAKDLFGNPQKPQTGNVPTTKELKTQELAAESLQELQEEEAMFRQQALNTVVSQVDSGDGTIIETTLSDVLNQVSENIQNLEKPDLSKIRIEGIITQEELFKQVNEPKMQKYIRSVLGETFNTDLLAMLPQQDLNKIILDITKSFGLIKNIPTGSPKAAAIQAENQQNLKLIASIIQKTITGE